MALRIYNNIEAQNAHRNLSINTQQLGKTMEKLSSGLRINRAGDDAAGLAVSEEMRTQIRGLGVAARNALDGVSLVQVADASIGGVNDLLQRMRELAVQAANGTFTDTQRSYLDAEVQTLLTELDRVGTDTEFNGLKIMSGALANAASALTLQIGAGANQSIAVTIPTVSTAQLTLTGVGISTANAAASAIASIDIAIRSVNAMRAGLGAVQNRLEQTINRVRLTAENVQAAESRIRDADMAMEMVDMTRRQILDQSGMAMLSQANQANNSVLRLLS